MYRYVLGVVMVIFLTAFHRAKIFIKLNLLNFYFTVTTFAIMSKNSLPKPKLHKFCSMFSSGSLIVLCFTFLIYHPDWLIFYEVYVKVLFFSFLNLVVLIVLSPFVVKIILFPVNYLNFCQKSHLKFVFCFTDPMPNHFLMPFNPDYYCWLVKS